MYRKRNVTKLKKKKKHWMDLNFKFLLAITLQVVNVLNLPINVSPVNSQLIFSLKYHIQIIYKPLSRHCKIISMKIKKKSIIVK